ncbi:MAG: glycerol acyltransferase [Deltaproteobacteria bacterium]|nr:MAG: glycerol acyltransferase [Deltaproteobacteria bacterium]
MSEVTRKKSLFLRWAQSLSGQEYGAHPNELDPAYLEQTTQRLTWLFGRYFKMDVQGFEQCSDEPSLVVSNHSGGMLLLDVLGMMVAWHQHRGNERPLHVLFHDMLMAMGWTGKRLSRMGGLRACPKAATLALQEYQRDVLVYPGGDQDAYRPYSQRNQVHFDGRKGYTRLALQTGSPITPVAHSGAHETLMVLSSGQGIAKMLGLPKLVGSKIFPIYLCFPWILSPGPFLPHFPLPRTFHYRLGTPIEMPRKTWIGNPPDEVIAMVDAKVRHEIQTMLNQIQNEKAGRKSLHTTQPNLLLPSSTS